ncbi:MAG: DUF296 domain-containing protein [Acidobacteria bacterium]|nr:DUF296 domain-containing protein [Acidobacteriota bacterium]
MKIRQINQAPRTFLVVFDIGDEAASGLLEAARAQGIRGAQIAAIGAFSSARVAFYNLATKVYEPIEISEQVEVLSLLGNISQLENGEIKVHVHCCVGKRDGSTAGGHLLEAHVNPTLEVVITETAAMKRRVNEVVGLPLLEP